MRTFLACLATISVFAVSCAGGGGADDDGAVMTASGGAGAGAGTSVGQTGGGTQLGSGGTAAGGGSSSGSGGEGSNSATGGAGAGAPVFVCSEADKALTLALSGSPVAIPGVPKPAADNWFLEGPVWIDGSLDMSQIRDYGPLNPANILKYTPGGSFEQVVADAGTNGLALNGAGLLVAASHKEGGIVTFDTQAIAAAPLTLVNEFEGSRFNSPNDLTVRSDVTIYFTDPDWQCTGCGHQPGKGVYKLSPTGVVEKLTVLQDDPNGISLSPDEKTLYVGGISLASYPVMLDGSIGAGSVFGDNFFQRTDGLGIDCAGNVYATTGDAEVKVFASTGALLGTISAAGARNVAFGGVDNKTLFIVGAGTPGTAYSLDLNVPGYPY